MDEILGRLNSMRNRARLGYLMHSLALLTTVVMIFQGQIAIAGALGAAAILLYLLFVRPTVREFNALYTKENLRLTLSRRLSELSYQPKAEGQGEGLRADRLLPVADRGVLVRHLVRGLDGETAVELMDLTTPVKDGAGRVRYLSGAWIRMKPMRPAHPGRLCAYGEVLYTGCALESYTAAAFDQPPRRAAEAAGDRQLLWLWEEEAEALRDQARTAVSDLAGYTPGDVALARSPEGCSVFIRHRFLAGPGLSLKTPVSAAQLSFDHFPELDRVLSIGRALLNTAPPG